MLNYKSKEFFIQLIIVLKVFLSSPNLELREDSEHSLDIVLSKRFDSSLTKITYW